MLSTQHHIVRAAILFVTLSANNVLAAKTAAAALISVRNFFIVVPTLQNIVLRKVRQDCGDKSTHRFLLVFADAVGDTVRGRALPDHLVARGVNHVDGKHPLGILLDSGRRHRRAPPPVSPTPVHRADAGAGIA